MVGVLEAETVSTFCKGPPPTMPAPPRVLVLQFTKHKARGVPRVPAGRFDDTGFRRVAGAPAQGLAKEASHGVKLDLELGEDQFGARSYKSQGLYTVLDRPNPGHPSNECSLPLSSHTDAPHPPPG